MQIMLQQIGSCKRSIFYLEARLTCFGVQIKQPTPALAKNNRAKP